jgi:uncharacterized protein (TIGR02145 family)
MPNTGLPSEIPATQHKKFIPPRKTAGGVQKRFFTSKQGEIAVKINKIYAYDLRNDAHFQFYTEFRNLVQKEEAVKQKIAPQFEAWLPLYDKEDTALKKIQKSAITAQIALLVICTAVFAQQKGTFKDSRDGKTYKTVKIGNQTWMAENLNYNAKGSKCYGEGGKVYYELKGENSEKTLSNNEIQANCTKYGRLYDWETAKTVCPAGWHLPSRAEWNLLGDNAKKLKATTGWYGDGSGTDDYGFPYYIYYKEKAQYIIFLSYLTSERFLQKNPSVAG